VDALYNFVLIYMVYISFAVFLVGTTFRLVTISRKPKQATSLQIYPEKRAKWLGALYDTFLFPSVRKNKPVLWFFLILFHACLLLLIIGHLELFGKFGIFQIIPHEVFLGKGFLGLIFFVTLMYFLFRRFLSPVRELSVPEDYYLLILLFLIVIFGSEMDWARRWFGYDQLLVKDYRAYLISLLTLKPALPYNVSVSGHSFMLVLHVFFANLLLIFFPFSHSIHSFLSVPMNKLRRG
jgi:nitrate reductase gamma subunit